MADLTIKEVAELLEVTPQAIYKILNKANNDLKQHLTTVKRNGKTLKAINNKGIELLKQRFNETINQHLNNDKKPLNKETAAIIEVLTKQLEAKDKQLETKDKQIQELNDRLKEQQTLTSNSQKLLLMEQQKALPGATAWEKVKGIFKRDDTEQ